MRESKAPSAPTYTPDYSKPVVLWQVIRGHLTPVARARFTGAFVLDFRRGEPMIAERGGVLLRLTHDLEASEARVRRIVCEAAEGYWHSLPEQKERDLWPEDDRGEPEATAQDAST